MRVVFVPRLGVGWGLGVRVLVVRSQVSTCTAWSLLLLVPLCITLARFVSLLLHDYAASPLVSHLLQPK